MEVLAPSKIRTFVWQVAWGKTLDRVQGRNPYITLSPQVWPMCWQSGELVAHLFLRWQHIYGQGVKHAKFSWVLPQKFQEFITKLVWSMSQQKSQWVLEGSRARNNMVHLDGA